MDLSTIQMDPHAARREFLAYRNAIRERHNAEDAQIMQVYKAIAAGQRVLNLFDAIRAGGQYESGLPKLAVVRADAPQAFFCRQGGGHFSAVMWNGAGRKPGTAMQLPEGTFQYPPSLRWNQFRSIAPNIPPALRPPFALSNYHLLWEAEWQPVAPKDPALLKHLGGPLYAVLAVWDLTEVERAVLGITRALTS